MTRPVQQSVETRSHPSAMANTSAGSHNHGRGRWMRRAAWSLALLAGLALAPATAQEVVSSFASGPGNGTYAFASWTPKTLPELMKGSAGGEAVNILGHLFLPPGDGGKAPAVVLVHGSGGIYNAELDYWPKHFNAAGIAVFTLDMFGPRGVRSTAEDQSTVPFAADVADVFAALRLLATHPRIDPQRIALMGFSRGGTAVLRANVGRIIASQKLPDGLHYAAFMPTYAGGCAGVFRLVVKPGVFTQAPMLFIHGDADDYTPISACRDYADKIAKAGTPVEFVTLAGAQHKFDADDQRRYPLRNVQRTKPDCPVEIDIDTLYAYDGTSGARLQGNAYTDALKSCQAVGATVEGSTRARDQAEQAAVTFLKKVFGL
ncbi:MAG TPA: prolyl oligopeptidase family serine peptidase [Alicycliphilus sp.]|nr:prolyl oligopeptidase family serine peptidase [Alicycliphilus sp.]